MADTPVQCELYFEIDDDAISVKMALRGFPRGATDRARDNRDGFARALQDAVMNFLGKPITRTDVHGVLQREGNEISEAEIKEFIRASRSKKYN